MGHGPLRDRRRAGPDDERAGGRRGAAARGARRLRRGVPAADRYETAAKVTERLGPLDHDLLASGVAFRDALAGAAVGAPLLLSRPDCLPTATADAYGRLGLASVTALGGTSALSDTAARGDRCPVAPAPLPAPGTSSVRDGSYLVGRTVQPGRYRAEGSRSCSWERSSRAGAPWRRSSPMTSSPVRPWCRSLPLTCSSRISGVGSGSSSDRRRLARRSHTSAGRRRMSDGEAPPQAPG
ncbi:cell wall-binding repeat-containing protein [Quadrisphaera sp. DSM 44207]|uniref:cell wall-binding repeat-containing protein n=1 Tax=Quadrisphaera sp. DSM 44207 TaxID=1881057 RepID=UPI000B85548E